MNNQDWLDEIDKRIEEERRSYKGPHCCMTMHYSLLSDANVLYYNPKYREYGVKIPKTKRYLLMEYCICCGKRLPTSLRIDWANRLEQEYALMDPMDQDKKKIPQDFLSDEWWKIRGIGNYNKHEISDLNEKQFNDKEPHFCHALYKELLSDGSLLDYHTKYREYGIKISRSTRVMLLDYCMFCGVKLPLSVRTEWFDILEKEYGLESPCEEDKKKVPKEFLTDEWWKKRGL